MRVAFLDIDGVLIPLPPNGVINYDPTPDSGAVKNLNILTTLGKAKIVVSSQWRVDRTLDELKVLLASWGVHAEVVDKTPEDVDEDADEDRGLNIFTWLSGRSDVESFVVIDDETVSLEPLAKKAVFPSPDKGLQFHDALSAIRILDGIDATEPEPAR